MVIQAHDVMLEESPRSAYMVAIEREDATLERKLTDIQARYDRSDLTRLEVANERIQALETHLAACQGYRRYYLGGN